MQSSLLKEVVLTVLPRGGCYLRNSL